MANLPKYTLLARCLVVAAALTTLAAPCSKAGAGNWTLRKRFRVTG